ncbi:efflux RND transporter permease subunit [Alkaliphilus sp. B6464]|uniref:efflux RND transporter permease subunit n=1 Tax=Alkaliphilus sp. B6464 TaxID=2731219 RepID=UPI001BA7A686|nr:MMPL family transporter [Alkaliphilus sp. B6464]QUH18641.1 MMPL family transporter [Alkaliphilus sp. B6464]
MDTAENKKTFWENMATFIVDKRNGFFLLFIGLIIFCVFSSQWVFVNNNLTDYLPENTETRKGLTLMENEFITYAAAKIMVSNITYEEAENIAVQLENIEGVSSVLFENNDKHFRSASALFEITFSGEVSDEISVEAMEKIRDTLSKYDLYISTEVGSSSADILNKEMEVVMIIAVIIIVSVLLFTSKTYLEIPVLLITFGAAALLNMGTNFLLGEISFVSDSIAVVLQLALAIDYAIILCHRYTEERAFQEPREAVIAALSKAIPEISASSLTTISGLLALMLMQFKIGFDMGIVLIKSIIWSLFSVFTLMPGLLMIFSKGIDKTAHRSFIPDITSFSRIVVKTRYIIPPIFIIVLILGFHFSNKSNYVYGYSTLTTRKQNEEQIAEKMIKDTFIKNNFMALLVPTGDYEKEGKLIAELESLEITDSAVGLANIKAVEDYVLTDTLTSRQFAELADLDIKVARLLYSAYAVHEESYGKIVNGLDSYAVPLIDMFLFLHEEKVAGYVTLDEELEEKLDNMYTQLKDAQLQLQGKNYTRLLINTNIPEEGEETFKWLNEIHKIAFKYYPKDIYLVGESTNNYDLSSSFTRDNTIIGITSAIFVMIVLLFTFQSAGLPVLLMLIIQGSIWISFSIPALNNVNIFFMSYLIVSSIQMGANIDYAIVITSRYQELKQTMPPSDAMVEALNRAFPTLITSGSILASAGLLIGYLSSEPSISSIGSSLGRGTIISMILVMGVLPQILLLGDTIIDKTGFKLKGFSHTQSHKGHLKVDGHVRGYVSGMIDAKIHGTVIGDVNALVEVGAIKQIDSETLSSSQRKEEDYDEEIK